MRLIYLQLLRTRRYASAGITFDGSVSVYLWVFITLRYCAKTVARIDLVLAYRLLVTYRALCFKEIR